MGMLNELNHIQSRELLMLQEFIRICEKYNLTYYILGGTLLGAVRHNGFIPWDDDIDLGMPRQDFEKFQEIVSSEVTAPFYCENDKDTPDYKLDFHKFCDSETKVYWEHNQEIKVVDLWMDIFPIDGMPQNYVLNKIHSFLYLYRRMLVNISQFDQIVNLNKDNRPFHETFIIALVKKLKLYKLVDFNKQKEKYKSFLKKYTMSEFYSGNFTGAYKLREIVPTTYFGNPVDLKFSGLSVKAPKQYLLYLEAIYGKNFMELPPVEKREAHKLKLVLKEK